MRPTPLQRHVLDREPGSRQHRLDVGRREEVDASPAGDAGHPRRHQLLDPGQLDTSSVAARRSPSRAAPRPDARPAARSGQERPAPASCAEQVQHVGDHDGVPRLRRAPTSGDGGERTLVRSAWRRRARRRRSCRRRRRHRGPVRAVEPLSEEDREEAVPAPDVEDAAGGGNPLLERRRTGSCPDPHSRMEADAARLVVVGGDSGGGRRGLTPHPGRRRYRGGTRGARPPQRASGERSASSSAAHSVAPLVAGEVGVAGLAGMGGELGAADARRRRGGRWHSTRRVAGQATGLVEPGRRHRASGSRRRWPALEPPARAG